MALKIEIGKSYRLKGGGMGIVLARVPAPIAEEAWLGAIASDHGFDSATWFEKGNYQKTVSSEFDIIGPFIPGDKPERKK